MDRGSFRGKPSVPLRTRPVEKLRNVSRRVKPPMILMEALRACSGRSRRQAIIASCSVGKSVEIALGCRVEGPRRVSDLCRSNYRQGRVFLNEWGTTIQRKHHCTSSEEAAND